jgi:hypothetical protein
MAHQEDGESINEQQMSQYASAIKRILNRTGENVDEPRSSFNPATWRQLFKSLDRSVSSMLLMFET